MTKKHWKKLLALSLSFAAIVALCTSTSLYKLKRVDICPTQMRSLGNQSIGNQSTVDYNIIFATRFDTISFVVRGGTLGLPRIGILIIINFMITLNMIPCFSKQVNYRIKWNGLNNVKLVNDDKHTLLKLIWLFWA